MGCCERWAQDDLLVVSGLNLGAERLPESPSIPMGRTGICWDYSVLGEGLGHRHRRVSRVGVGVMGSRGSAGWAVEEEDGCTGLNRQLC